MKTCIHGKVESHYAELMENDIIVAYFHTVTNTDKNLAKYWAENELNMHTRIVEFVENWCSSYLGLIYNLKLCSNLYKYTLFMFNVCFLCLYLIFYL